MADKQHHLNGAYYGPAVPPAEPLHRGHRRQRSCCCCLFGIIWKLVVAIIVLIGLYFLIFYLVVQPRSFKFYVTEAKLTQFDYAKNNLTYDLVLNFTVRNPNKKLSIYYDDVEARAFYEGKWFNTTDFITDMNSFRQYKKSTDAMSGTFRGQQHLTLMGDDLSKFNEDKTNGVFDIYIRLYFRIRFRLGDVTSGDVEPKVKCELKVPLTKSNGTTTTAFESTKCDVDL